MANPFQDKIVVNVQLATPPASQIVFIADNDYEILEVNEVHAVAGTDAGAVTVDVKKLTGTDAPTAGTSVLGSTFNAKGVANTNVRKIKAASGLATALTTRRLVRGNRLSVVFTGVLTALANVCVSITLRRTGKPTY